VDLFKTAGAVIDCSRASVYYWANNLGSGVKYDRLPPARDIGVEALVIASVAVANALRQFTLVDRCICN